MPRPRAPARTIPNRARDRWPPEARPAVPRAERGNRSLGSWIELGTPVVIAMSLIVGDGVGDPLLERNQRLPAEHAVDLAPITDVVADLDRLELRRIGNLGDLSRARLLDDQ